MFRAIRTFLVLACAALASSAILLPTPARTLPLFARDLKLACTTCHMAFPRLNTFGMHFKQNGYRMPGQMGTSPWEKEHFPLSLIGNVGAQLTRADVDTGGTSRVVTTTSGFKQNWVEFHTAGTLAPKVTFHFDNGFAEDTGVLESGMAFVQFDDVAHDGLMNVKVGIFDGEIPYLSDARRTTLAGYLTDWTQDNRGVELNGTNSKWMYAAGLVNSQRTQGRAGSNSLHQLENVYAWLERDISSSMVTARVLLDRQDPRKADATASLHRSIDVSAYLSPSSGRWALIPAVTLEHFNDVDVEKDRNTGMLEAITTFGNEARWVATGRYERSMTPAAGGAPDLNLNQAAVNLAYYVNPNARIALDLTHGEQNGYGPKLDQVQVFVHVGY